MAEPDLVFYDGDCGLCHRWVKFVLRRDRDGSRFRFAPLRGSTLGGALPQIDPSTFPDSIVVKPAAGDVLFKSSAVLHLFTRLGGVWKVLAALGRVVPRGLRDWAYDRVASVRHRLSAKPADACPVLPPELRGRFLP